MSKQYWNGKKESKSENISDFKAYKLLQRMAKKRSPLIVDFLTEDEDFIDVISYRRKTGLVTNHSVITTNQIHDWIDRFERLKGFERAD